MKLRAFLLVGILFVAIVSCSKDTPTGPKPVAPDITSQPQSQTVGVGSVATFSVVATGNPAPTYQWQRNGVDISGATMATYTMNAVAFADSGNYAVVVTNNVGSKTSLAATLSVSAVAPLISVQPQSQSVEFGMPATFSVTASSPLTLSYQWKKNGNDIAGATTASFTIPAVTFDDTAAYTVEMRTSADTVTSIAALLTVTQPPMDLTVVGKWEGSIASIPLVNFNGAQIFPSFRKSDSTFRLISRDSTRHQTTGVKDTMLIITGTWSIQKAKSASSKDSVLLLCDSAKKIDTAMNALVPNDSIHGLRVPVCINIAKNNSSGDIEWAVTMKDFIPLAPYLRIDIPSNFTFILNIIQIVFKKKSQLG
jgi:hypothetical protein